MLIRSDRFMNAQPAVLGCRSRRTAGAGAYGRRGRSERRKGAPLPVMYVLTGAAAPSPIDGNVVACEGSNGGGEVSSTSTSTGPTRLIRHSEGRTLRSGAQFPLLSRMRIRRSLYHGVQKDRISNAVDGMVGKEKMWL